MAAEQTVKSVLAVGAHPDDIEILCGGTLAKYAQQGVKVSMAIATDGAAGHMVIPPKELAEIRHQEAQKSADIIGADLYWLGFGDELIFEDLETRMVFVELIRKAKPDVIISHTPQDYHPDHRVVSRLMFDASFMSGLKNIETESPYHPGVQPLVYFDTVTGANFLPTEFVDISETFATKQEMLSCFESQLKWLKDHDNVDFLYMVEVQTRSRGYQCGVPFAEAFGSENVWPRSRPYRLLP
jgi:LmbE family N-acetylglucosaminyl deacetylase